MKQYLELMKKIMDEGVERNDRTGVGTRGIFGHQMRFDLNKGFPLVTTKKVHLKSIIYELLWFLRGDTNIKYLNDHGVTIWDEWADGKGELGPIYGKQWVRWETVDGQKINQIAQAVDLLKNSPESRRIMVSAWNVGDLQAVIKDKKAAPPACNSLFQLYVQDGHLSCLNYMRSNDIFLGAPFNIAQYALLTMMMAQAAGLKLGEYIHTNGDAHIYKNHFEQVKTQLSRKPYPLPTIKINPKVKDIFKFRFEDFELVNYKCHPGIKAPIAI